MIIRMTRKEAEEILAANRQVFIRRHAGSAIVQIDGDLTLKELTALAWLVKHCPDWESEV